MGMKLLVLHGPNLNLLGEQESSTSGRLEALNRALRERAEALQVSLKVVQSNHEGVLLDALHAERRGLSGVVVNPTGLFGSHALREALELVGAPAIEVSLGPPREGSVVAEACVARVGGRGFESYLEALERLAGGEVPRPEARPKRGALARTEPEEDRPEKSLGRKAQAAAPALEAARPAEAPVERPGKTLGRKQERAEEAPAERPGKTLGRGGRAPEVPSNLLSRALVRQRIADRLGGRLGAAELSTWARERWGELQRGAPVEEGHRAQLEDTLQRLTLAQLPATRLSDEQLVDLMTRLDG